MEAIGASDAARVRIVTKREEAPMRHRPRSGILFIPLLLLFAAGAAANVSPPASDNFRCELNQFVSDLGNVHPLRVNAAEGLQKVESLTPQELQTMEITLSTLPKWQELPTVMASLAHADEAHTRQVIARILERSGPAAGTDPQAVKSDEDFRADFMFLLEQLGRFGPVMNPGYADSVTSLREQLAQMPAAALPLMRKEYEKRAPEWQALLNGTAGPQGVAPAVTGESLVSRLTRERVIGAKPVAQGCGGCCGDVITCVDCWINIVGCYINEVGSLVNQVAGYVTQIANFISDFFTVTIPGLFNQIAALPGQVISFFTKVFDDVKNFVTSKFNDLINLVPHSVNDVLAFIGFDPNNLNWETIANSIPTIAPPCPQQAVDIAAEVCDRGGDALTQLLFDLAPDDGLSFLFKAGLALIHYPLMYLCQCHDIQEAIEIADAEAAHRDWTGQHLDLQLSTRATQSSVNALSLSLTGLDNDVAKVEAKLDIIGATAGRIDVNTKRIDATVNRIETNVNHTEATTDRTEKKIDALTTGNSGQQGFLGDFTTLMKRVHIENNLLEVKPNVISFFQLPNAFGGNLETVGMIVADTIKMNLNAKQTIFGAERELSRADGLIKVGDFVKAYEAYRSAYSEAVK